MKFHTANCDTHNGMVCAWADNIICLWVCVFGVDQTNSHWFINQLFCGKNFGLTLRDLSVSCLGLSQPSILIVTDYRFPTPAIGIENLFYVMSLLWIKNSIIMIQQLIQCIKWDWIQLCTEMAHCKGRTQTHTWVLPYHPSELLASYVCLPSVVDIHVNMFTHQIQIILFWVPQTQNNKCKYTT